MARPCLSRPLEILLVEDNPSDARLIAKAFEGVSQPCNIRIISDGELAIAFLYQIGSVESFLPPDLILLDLHLPKKGGIEVLQEIKSSPQLAAIPVIMLTASSSQHDIDKCYQQEANCYLLKPHNLQELNRTMQILQDFWLKMVKLPLV